MSEPAPAEPFWKTLALSEMSSEQWESLCDGCGRCCLNKLLYEDTGEIAWTNVACTLLDGETCRCTDYPNRHARVADCQALTPENVPGLTWLPPTCGYRLVAEGRDLYWWHPLVSSDPETVHAAGISVKGKTLGEGEMTIEDLEDYVVAWPGEIPTSAESLPPAARERR
jgi:uncharacterized cysteine cluster protein YcgN (CxxCxxCC family)